MYQDLGTATLNTGELFSMGCVLAPDADFAERVPTLLSHKDQYVQWHLKRSLAGPLDELETRFYLGQVGDEIICNIMTVECSGSGILGHVFTEPAHRRKGACKLLMAEQMADFVRRGGKCLILGTGYDTHPYYIYKGFGFESIAEERGEMRYTVHGDEEFVLQHFAKASTSVCLLAWGHWPPIAVLGSFEWQEHLKSILPPIYGPFNFEGYFYPLKQRCEERADWQCSVLESKTGAVVAFASMAPDVRFAEQTYVLDLFGHPDFAGDYAKLVRGLTMPTAKVQAYADSRSEAKIAALKEAGFSQEARLVGQLKVRGKPLDVLVFCAQ